jgi:hypothetical protein
MACSWHPAGNELAYTYVRGGTSRSSFNSTYERRTERMLGADLLQLAGWLDSCRVTSRTYVPRASMLQYKRFVLPAPGTSMHPNVATNQFVGSNSFMTHPSACLHLDRVRPDPKGCSPIFTIKWEFVMVRRFKNL